VSSESPPLVFEHVGKRFGETVVLADVHFRTEPGELVVLVGPSGCGKSTLMRLVAGLETVSEGAIFAGARKISELPPHERGVGMVFQSYALYPHLTVRENLAFPLYVKKASKEEQDREVRRVADMLSLGPLLDRLPKQLSGGQRQRVAIGRCLVRKPDIYCFDEPLSNLDAALRSQIRVELKSLQRDLKKTTIYVTHDQIEAMTMADRIVVLHKGVLQQVGTPEELYLSPQNTFVARFIGSPSMSLVRGDVEAGIFRSGDLTVPLRVRSGTTIVGLRAEDVLVSPDGPLSGVVKSVEPVGETGYLHLEVAGMRLDPASLGAPGSATETPRAPLLAASISGRDAFACREGTVVRFSIREGRAHAFDPDSGEALARDATARATS
jgi:ABC-type sugar transport system ATPase subunit